MHHRNTPSVCSLWQLKQAGTMCRGPAGACDLPEYCTGASPYCPSNVYLLDGSSCQYGLAYCYNGMCLTHEQQCLQLWGYGKDSYCTHKASALYHVIIKWSLVPCPHTVGSGANDG